ncbi:MAG: hypothetical protein JNM88_04085 [Chitinophagaceae bacterium]|nr:hypothetical protein [Chitinophagaceae bacterium]
MFHKRINIILSSFLIGAVLLTSCASYNKQASSYYYHLRQGNYHKAAVALDDNKLLNKDRNRLLFLLERGKICHLLNQWDSSNNYLNEADNMMEEVTISAKDIALGTLINPMMQSYKPEGFEKYLVHYYKALNYLQIGQPQEALVEARRISLRTYEQQDKPGNNNKYSDDAFSLMLQGLIYEKNGDVNNAFIAYRNATDVFLKNNGIFYDTRMPEQLKKDLLRTAFQIGFTDELNRYERLLNTSYTKENIPEGGELVVFWENGSAPVKIQQDLYFSMIKDAGGGFFFRDGGGFYNIPFDVNNSNNSNDIKLENLRSFRVALPAYKALPVFYSGASLIVNNSTYSLEQAENINTLAFTTLKERLLIELSTTLTRLAVKKLAEAAIRPPERKNDSNKTEEEKKKQEKKDNQREAIALGLQLFNFATEKADTRNWQSLPHSIYYTRVPLQKGENNITLQLNGTGSPAINFTATGTGGIQFKNVCTLK